MRGDATPAARRSPIITYLLLWSVSLCVVAVPIWVGAMQRTPVGSATFSGLDPRHGEILVLAGVLTFVVPRAVSGTFYGAPAPSTSHIVAAAAGVCSIALGFFLWFPISVMA